MTLNTGSRIGRYEIRAKIGEGGMGEVYLAQDTQLERTVALKVLPADVVAAPQRINRFMQEAKAASALNHPNILTVYEIGSTDALRFIATEFIDGDTLRQWMQNAPKLGEVLDIVVQIASALSAAHAVGIIHRDIKPENIMRRRDGIVKILDFGLAKLVEKTDPETVDADAVTKALVQTEPGSVLGTVAYMSPEQVRGFAVDERTDIFSLGIVIYELVAGRTPFGGPTRSDLIVSLLDREPPPLTRFAAETPAELERIVMKALAKDRDERYQTAKDLLIDLKRLKQKLTVDAEIERITPTELAAKQSESSPTGDRVVSTAPVETTRTALDGIRATSSAEYFAAELKRHKKSVALIFAALVVALGYGLYKFASQKRPLTSPPAIKMARLTATGKMFAAVISPDGKHVVYGVEEAGKQSIWLKQIATASNVPIVPPSEAIYSNFSFSRDGNYIYFNKREKTGPDSLYQMTALGAMARKIVDNVSSRAALSADGNRIAFVRGGSFAKENSLVVANSDGSGEQVLATHKSPEKFSLGGIAWPPDGKSITCVAGPHDEKLIEVPLDGGAEKLVRTPQWFTLMNIEWLPDGSGLIVIAREQTRASPSQIWYLSYPSGEARRITPDFSSYANLSLTADASMLVVTKQETTSHIWLAPDGDASRAKQLTTGPDRRDGDPAVNWTPDGKIVYDSTSSGSRHPWIMNADGSDQRQLTDGAYEDRGTHVSHDGRYLVFTSNRTGTYHVYRIDIDGNNLKQLTDGPGEIGPRFSPDGLWVICNSLDYRSWKVPAAGGELVQLTNSWASGMSPDGKLVAYVRPAEANTLFWNITIIPFAGGPPLKTFDVTSDSRPIVRWTPDGRAISYNLTHGGELSGVTNLWIQALDGGPAKQLTNFTSETFFSFDWSRDGKWLAYGRSTTSSDVVLISNFR
jgi:serine/threonine protein kinase/Tol biopolymer transport system component